MASNFKGVLAYRAAEIVIEAIRLFQENNDPTKSEKASSQFPKYLRFWIIYFWNWPKWPDYRKSEVNFMPNARLTRSDTDRLLAGVCGGIAAYLNLDATLVRLAFLVLLFASGIGLPMYLILWVIMPVATDVNKPGSAVVQDNIEEMGVKVSSSVNRLGRPGTVGVILVSLGAFFLLTELGLSSSFLWPALFIGAGIYWLIRRGR